VDSVVKILRTIYGANAPDPIEYKITRWGQDEFAFGSYSYIAPPSKPSDYDLLAAPVTARSCERRKAIFRLFFAGEGTNMYYPATIHGAFLSGIREARKISSLFHTSSGSHGPLSGLEAIKKLDAVMSECKRMAMPKRISRPADELSVMQIRKRIIHNFTFGLSSQGPSRRQSASFEANAELQALRASSQSNGGGKLEVTTTFKQGDRVSVLQETGGSDEAVVTFVDKVLGTCDLYFKDGTTRTVEVGSDSLRPAPAGDFSSWIQWE